jgi:polyhydroxyalkanoate synthase subunit PhaC
MQDLLKPWAALSVQPEALLQVQRDFVSQAAALWNQALQGPAAAFNLKDRRFAAPDWGQNLSSAFTVQMYLLQARTLTRLADGIQGEPKMRERVRFAVQQWIDAAAPSNFLAFNPEAQQKALHTQGQSLMQGLQQLWRDVQQGRISQTDERGFELGKNIANTEGAVVFENDLFQLIEYKPLTKKVDERPILLVPPCINKYYILDLQPANSLIKYTVEKGFRVFVISWRNPDASMAQYTWDQYVENAVIYALTVVQEIADCADKNSSVHTLGFCVGGTLLSTALAVLAARGQQPAASLTLLTTLLDFTDTGILDLFIDEASVRLRETTIGLDAPEGGGLLKGQELASTFGFLRSNDLVWNYVVGNYLKGETPPPFDLLYWNGDATHLPGPMYCWYLRHTYLQNELKVPGQLTVCGEKIDLSKIEAPVYIYGSREDHIVPWASAYRSVAVFQSGQTVSSKTKARGKAETKLAAQRVRFVLGASGHIAGVINPPAKNKRNYWVWQAQDIDTLPLPAESEDWFHLATEKPGSWWTDWADWLSANGGKTVAPPKQYGSIQYPVIEPAPGRYVKQKAVK